MNMKFIIINSYLFQIRVWSQPDKINQTEYAIEIISQCFKFFTEYFNITDVLNKTGKSQLIATFGILIQSQLLELLRQSSEKHLSCINSTGY